MLTNEGGDCVSITEKINADCPDLPADSDAVALPPFWRLGDTAQCVDVCPPGSTTANA